MFIYSASLVNLVDSLYCLIMSVTDRFDNVFVYCGQSIKSHRPQSLFRKFKLFFSKRPNRLCSSEWLCPKCFEKKKQLCRNYHLTKYTYNTLNALKYYFKNVPPFILDTINEYGSSEVERQMRTYYEQLYIQNTDTGHDYFKNNILRRDAIPKDDVALSNNNYWKIIFFLVLVNLYKHQPQFFNEDPVATTRSLDDLSNINVTDKDFIERYLLTIRHNYWHYKRQFSKYDCNTDALTDEEFFALLLTVRGNQCAQIIYPNETYSLEIERVPGGYWVYFDSHNFTGYFSFFIPELINSTNKDIIMSTEYLDLAATHEHMADTALSDFNDVAWSL